MEKVDHNTENKKTAIFILAAFFIFFTVLWKISDLGIYPDSGAYMSMQQGREPVYPLFLAFFRKVFREKDTLVWMASSGALDSEEALKLLREWPALHVSTLVQSLLDAVSCYYLGNSVCRVFLGKDGEKRKSDGIYALFIYLATMLPYVLTPLASASHMVLGRAVSTEGLAFPLFGFFAGSLIRMLFLNGSAVIPFFVLLLLVLTRSQMLLFLPVYVILLGIRLIFKDRVKKIKVICTLALSLALFLFLRSGLNSLYTNTFNPGYKGASTGHFNMLTTFIYLGDDAAHTFIEDGAAGDLYEDMRQEAEKRDLTRDKAPGGILLSAYHYEDAYDTIGFEIQQPLMFEAAEDNGFSEREALNEVIRLSYVMTRGVSRHLFVPYIENYLATAISGLTRSIAASGNIMGIFALILYCFALVFIVVLWKEHKKEALFMLFALLMIGANCFGTALMIMCLSRYMIYNTPLFYMAFLMCFRAVLKTGFKKCHTEI